VQEETLLSEEFIITGGDHLNAGQASVKIKEILKQIGLDPSIVRRVAIASFEAEMNVVMYARRGVIHVSISPSCVELKCQDEGDGIEDIQLALQEGYSTATDEMREMGFGAGMGLPNIKKNSDTFQISSAVGEGTTLLIKINTT
jgi:anti-sigma regulatory factor (Ser/Thr protein kinase)